MLYIERYMKSMMDLLEYHAILAELMVLGIYKSTRNTTAELIKKMQDQTSMEYDSIDYLV